MTEHMVSQLKFVEGMVDLKSDSIAVNSNIITGAGINNTSSVCSVVSNSSGSGQSCVLEPVNTNSFSGENRISTNKCKVVVRNLDKNTNSEQLKDYFSKFGSINKATVILDPLNQKSRRYGFVFFDDPATVQTVLNVITHILNGQRIYVHSGLKKHSLPRFPFKTVFMGGIRYDTTQKDIAEYFIKSGFGKPKHTFMPTDPMNRKYNKGYAFAVFECTATVERICLQPVHMVKGKLVECNRWVPDVKPIPINFHHFADSRLLSGIVSQGLDCPVNKMPQTLADFVGIPLFMMPRDTTNSLCRQAGIDHHRQSRYFGNHRYTPYRTNLNATNLNNYIGTIPFKPAFNQADGWSLQVQPQPFAAPVDVHQNFDWSWFFSALL